MLKELTNWGWLLMISVPKHIAITMDGNGRWGRLNGLTRSEGHYAGTQTMEKIIKACLDLKIETLTLYAFSSENWSRPKAEVNYLMYLPVRFFKQKIPIFMEKNIKIIFSGDLSIVPKRTRIAISDAINRTKHNNGITVNFAFNYGGREDILQATRKMIEAVQCNELDIDEVNESTLEHYLYTCDLPDPDLFIRTGGEKRMSNFLLWQSSGSELYFTNVYFPDFNKAMLIAAIDEYNRRQSASDCQYYHFPIGENNRTASH